MSQRRPLVALSTLSLLAFAAACAPAASPPAANGDAGVVLPPATTTATVDPMTKLPHPPALAAATPKVVGYPRPVTTGMNDPAQWVGFTADGSEYGYCATLGARDEPTTTCGTVLRDGTTKKRSTDDAHGDYSNALAKSLTDWQTRSGLTKLAFEGNLDQWVAKPVRGTWAFTDVTIWVNPVAGDGTAISAVVKLGGSVAGEAPVYPVVLQAKTGSPRVTHHTSWVNDLSLSPDGSEIGMVGGFFCMEWCDDFVVYRNGTAAFASLVYNDTGFRHHQKGEYARAAELFLEATWADPLAKLPPYNLACAWARLGDARAKDALVVAIARDPNVKLRAPGDADFASVKDTDWFRALVSGS